MFVEIKSRGKIDEAIRALRQTRIARAFRGDASQLFRACDTV